MAVVPHPENVIRIEPTQFFHPKSQDSTGDIQIDPENMANAKKKAGERNCCSAAG
jgi:hypothetical protein